MKRRSFFRRLTRHMVFRGIGAATKLLHSNKHTSALRLLRFMADSAPTIPTTHLWLAKVSLDVEEPFIAQKALSAVRGTLDTNPYWPCRAAACHNALGQWEEAWELLAATRKRFSESWLVWQACGLMHSMKSEMTDVVRCMQRAISLAPTTHVRVSVMYTFALCLEEHGMRDDAVAIYKRIIDIASDETYAYFRLVMCQHDCALTDPYADRLLRLLRSPSIDTQRRRHAHFALGHIYDRIRRPGDAFAHFHLANELRALMIKPPNLKQLREDVDARIELFRRETIASAARHACHDDSAIFVVGMPRSGTTLTEQILSSHPQVRGLGERVDVLRCVQMLRWEIKSSKAYPWCVAALSPEVIRRLSGWLAHQRRKDAGRCKRIVTKAPTDLWDLGLIAMLFPKARIVHCRRHPIDTCLSAYMQNFADVPFSTSLDQLAEVFKLYRRIMAHWHDILAPSSICDVAYEDLVKRPHEVVYRLCQFCDLPFEDDCLRFSDNRRRVVTASQWQVRRPMYNTSVGRWRQYREYLGPLLQLDEDGGDSERPVQE